VRRLATVLTYFPPVIGMRIRHRDETVDTAPQQAMEMIISTNLQLKEEASGNHRPAKIFQARRAESKHWVDLQVRVCVFFVILYFYDRKVKGKTAAV